MSYICAICGKEYETITGRNKCETSCLTNFKKVERQKADTVRIKSLLNNYIKSVNALNDLVDTINSETQLYFQNYKMLYAPKDIEDRLSKLFIPNVERVIPDLVKFDSPIYANESAAHTFTTYESTLYDKNKTVITEETVDSNKIKKVNLVRINYGKF